MENEHKNAEDVDVATLQHLKQVSRIKHRILEKYLPAWAIILGSANARLCYFDCFAGPGRYEMGGEAVDGSPIIAVKAAKEVISKKPDQQIALLFMEKDTKQVDRLVQHLKPLQPYPKNLYVELVREDSHEVVPTILNKVPSLAPSFFMVDPYGHPLSIPVINQILQRQKTEVFINLMWFRINMDLDNSLMWGHLNNLFGGDSWRNQPFMDLRGHARENRFLEFFISKIKAKYVLPFRVGFDEKEDRMPGKRTKYYLLHASNHPRAVLLMKEVMWPLGDEEGTFDYSGESQGVLISSTPTENELRDILSREFSGQELSFDEIRQRAAALPPHSAIFFGLLVVDAAGVPYENDEALKSVHAVANAPIFGLYENQLGIGVVGGSLLPNQDVGVEAARVALRVLRGEVPSSIPTKPIGASAPLYDWRELRRWGISEARLPPGSIVRFRESTFWQQYHWYVAGALAIIAIEAVLIAGLLLQRSRRRRAESELRESQEFMELSTSAGELGLWMRDLTGGDLWTNPRLRSLFGFGQSDVLRIEDVFARIHPDDRSQVVSLLQHAQEDGLPFETEFRVLNNGTERWIAAKGRSVGNAPGGATRRMGVLTEITARKEAELETQRHRNELAHVSRVSMMGQLASALAHELNQPLGAILRNAEAAELFIRASPPDLQEVCAILADIRKDDQRAGDVIDRMRALLQRREFQWSDLDLNALVEDVAGLLRTDAEARRVKVSLELALPAPVRGDRVQLQQVMLNLILNAMDAINGCDAGKRAVTVHVRRMAAWAEVAVSDTASGITEENLKRLFEPFFTTKPTGLGLGLAISHTIIEAHGGRLWAENNPAAGATFRFTLPVGEVSRDEYLKPETG